jgi:hypothetical protein
MLHKDYGPKCSVAKESVVVILKDLGAKTNSEYDSDSESRVAVAEARGQFGNQEEGQRPPFEAVTRRLVKAQQAEKT